MSQLEKLQNIVNEPMARFKDLYAETLRSDNKDVNLAVDYIIKMQGKHMRPILALLSAGACGKITDAAIASAVLIEMTHTASLVHDDIVDEAFQRRSQWSVGALWRSRQAVLMGDYVLAKGINLAVKYKMFDVLGMIGSVIEKMSRGEILQNSFAISMDIDERGYFEVVECKTAALISAAASAGAITAAGREDQIAAMRCYGDMLGKAFQIKDDILDFTASSKIGKPVCNDIKERKITLPLIYALEGASKKSRKEILNCVRDAYKSDGCVVKVKEFVLNEKGIDRSYEKMEELKSGALEAVATFDDNIYKEALTTFAEYTLSRDK